MATFLSNPARHSPRNPAVAHDTATPEGFLRFMMQGWEATAKPAAVPYEHAANARQRRERLSKLFPGEALVIPSGHLKVRSNDEYYPFRACSDFVYLTGNQEPDCVLILLPESAGHRAVLFVEPNPGKSDASFFADRVKGELWEGARLGVPESAARYQIDDTRSLLGLEAFVRENVVPLQAVRMLRHHDAPLESWIGRETDAQRELDAQLEARLSELRLIKDEVEIAELRLAVGATRRGFEDVIRRLRTAASERELEGVFFTRARVEGNATGYGTVVAAGAHACTLHWRKNDGAVRSGDLLLLDAGVEARSLYTADITRTVPIGGRFSTEQREIYDLVFAAQRAAIEAVKPGNDFMEPNRVAMRVLAHGLERLGILTVPAEEALKEENQFYRRYTLHNVSHMLGLDVHDCAKARSEVYRYGRLVPGMVLTIEPGLYFQVDDTTVPPKYRGIGVRIEDNVLVTQDGVANLSDEIPAQADEVERWMAEVTRDA